MNDINQVDWDSYLKNVNPNKAIIKTIHIIETFLEKHAPTQKVKMKKVNEKIKPWITQGILISIKNKKKLHKRFLTEKNPTTKLQLHNQFKTYRNLITTLNRRSKCSYFKEYFYKIKKP